MKISFSVLLLLLARAQGQKCSDVTTDFHGAGCCSDDDASFSYTEHADARFAKRVDSLLELAATYGYYTTGMSYPTPRPDNLISDMAARIGASGMPQSVHSSDTMSQALASLTPNLPGIPDHSGEKYQSWIHWAPTTNTITLTNDALGFSVGAPVLKVTTSATYNIFSVSDFVVDSATGLNVTWMYGNNAQHATVYVPGVFNMTDEILVLKVFEGGQRVDKTYACTELFATTDDTAFCGTLAGLTLAYMAPSLAGVAGVGNYVDQFAKPRIDAGEINAADVAIDQLPAFPALCPSYYRTKIGDGKPFIPGIGFAKHTVRSVAEGAGTLIQTTTGENSGMDVHFDLVTTTFNESLDIWPLANLHIRENSFTDKTLTQTSHYASSAAMMSVFLSLYGTYSSGGCVAFGGDAAALGTYADSLIQTGASTGSNQNIVNHLGTFCQIGANIAGMSGHPALVSTFTLVIDSIYAASPAFSAVCGGAIGADGTCPNLGDGRRFVVV